MPRKVTPLALLALVAIAAAVIAGLAGQEAANPDPAAQRKSAGHGDSGRRDERKRTRRDPALEPAARYALAARNWTPESYRDSWQRQIALAAGLYRRELEAKRPGPRELRTLREDRARSRAKLVRAERDPRVRTPAARVLVTLKETTVAAGQTITGLTVNEVRLRYRGGRWGVVAWTVLPGGASP